MHHIVRRLGDTGDMMERGRKSAAEIGQGDAAGGSQRSNIGQDLKPRIMGDGEDLIVVSCGNIFLRRRQQEVGIAAQIPFGNHLMVCVAQTLVYAMKRQSRCFRGLRRCKKVLLSIE